MYLIYLIIVEFLISNFCILEFNLINITTLPQKKKKKASQHDIFEFQI